MTDSIEDAFPISGEELRAAVERSQRGFNRLFAVESPRGAAVLARAYLESALKGLLKASRKVPSAKCDPRGDSLEALIADAAQQELISQEQRQRMDLLRLIGNAFAHNPRLNDFAQPDIASLMAKLTHALFADSVEVRPKDTLLISNALIMCLDEHTIDAIFVQHPRRPAE